ncbi:hypothetical protein IWQ48_004226 [Labrenzia sp. EL_13]|nr:hypothetical protein [Labrenzia sp. EL_13]
MKHGSPVYPRQLSFDLRPANDNTSQDLTASDDLEGEAEQAEANWFELHKHVRQLQHITDGPCNDNSREEAGRLIEILYDLLL